MTPDSRTFPRRARVAAAVSTALLCLSATLDTPQALARSIVPPEPWPPSWQGAATTDFSPVTFTPPSATDCRRLPGTREVGGSRQDGGPPARPMAERADIAESLSDVKRSAGKADLSRERLAPPAARRRRAR